MDGNNRFPNGREGMQRPKKTIDVKNKIRAGKVKQSLASSLATQCLQLRHRKVRVVFK